MTNQNNNNSFFKNPAKWYGSQVVNETGKYQKQYGFEIGSGEHAMWNNEADAFKHTFMQAQLGLIFGKHTAKFLGDWHEKDGRTKMGQSYGEENMDKWNNEHGREIAREIIREHGALAGNPFNLPKMNDTIAKKVMERMNEGKLITNPNDTRKYHEKKPWFAGKNFSTGQAAPINETGRFDESEGHWVTMNGAHVFIKY